MSAPIGTADELFHERPGGPDWNESGWFSLNVPERHLSGFVYTHHRANRGYAWAGLGLWDASSSDPHSCLWHDYTVHPLQPREQAVGHPVFGFEIPDGLAARTIEPLRDYRLSYANGDCVADLRWRSLRAPIMPGFAEGWRGFGAGHFEQIGRMTGTLRLYDEVIAVDCLSIRDRSWGPHKAAGLARGGYPWAAASAGHAFQVQAVSERPPCDDPVIGTTESVKKGWYILDDQVGNVVAGERKVVRSDDGRPVRLHLEATDDRGRTLRAEGRCVNWLKMSFTGMFWWWCLTEWDLGDGARCWGEEIDFFAAPTYRRFARSLSSRQARPLVSHTLPHPG